MHFQLITDGVCRRKISWTSQAAEPSAPCASLSRDDRRGSMLVEMTAGGMLSRDDWRVFVMSTAVETSRSSNATAPWQDVPQARKATTLRVKRTVHNSFQEKHLFFVQQGVPHAETE